MELVISAVNHWRLTDPPTIEEIEASQSGPVHKRLLYISDDRAEEREFRLETARGIVKTSEERFGLPWESLRRVPRNAGASVRWLQHSGQEAVPSIGDDGRTRVRYLTRAELQAERPKQT